MGVQKLRVAVNGYGVIGKRVAAAVAQQDDMSLAGVSDVVCGLPVDPAKAAGSGEFNGKTYYFCSKGCKTKFDASPAQYAKIKRPVM